MSALTFQLAATCGTDLSSRHRAAELREQIVESVASGLSPITIDFVDVRTVSQSFADELIAVLVAEHGEDWFRQNLRLTNLSRQVRLSLLEAADARSRSQIA